MTDELELKKIVGEVAAAYFGNSHVTPNEIASVISQIASSIAAVGVAAPEAPVEAAEQTKLTPAQIRRSITREALISFEDNKPYKTMRRHLASRGMTPEEYRTKWGLPRDYPMVAPAYSEARSNLAKERGLGGRLRPPTPTAPQAQPEAAAEPAAQPATEAAAPTRRMSRVAAARAATPRSVKGAEASSAGAAKRRRSAPALRRTKKPSSNSEPQS